jgi:uncharacterized Zn-binding protein involved in type VI secretion
MGKAARVGDPGSHGGAIIEGSPNHNWDGKAAARVSDRYGCPKHGPNPIVTGSAVVFIDGKAAARVGDRTACGASIVDGSPITHIND